MSMKMKYRKFVNYVKKDIQTVEKRILIIL